MANIYKLESLHNKKQTKQIFTLSGAKKYQEIYAKKGVKMKIVLFARDVIILDNESDATGVVISFRHSTIVKKKHKESEIE